MISVLFVLATKEKRVTPKQILMPEEHQQSMKSTLQKSQDHASNAVDHTFKNRCTNTSYNGVYILRSTVFSTLRPLDIGKADINEIS